MKEDDLKYQTPESICRYMADMIPADSKTILEPTPGIGNLVRAIEDKGDYTVTAPENYFQLDKEQRFDCVVMNPPFSSKYAFGIPDGLEDKGMRLGYFMLQECMEKSNHVIALMPWFTISDSDVRLRALVDYGLKSITALPRKTFNYIRVQTMVLELERGYKGKTEFKTIRKI